MPIGIGSGLWAYCGPIDETNIQSNPSFEQGTSGVVAIQGATLGTTSQFQRYGAWSLKVTPSSNGTSGAILGTWTSGNGTTYSVSAWCFVEQGVPMRLAVGDGNGLNLTSGSVTFTGGGTWQWYNTGIIEAAQGTRSIVIQKTSGNSQLSFYVDGVKNSPWTDSNDRVTTYLDGDQPGGTWLGAPHNSQSFRSGQYRGGGSIVALADLGFSVDQALGVGVPPIEVSTQSYAVTDGAQFQRQRAGQRKFTLTAKPIMGTSTADFHVTRRSVFDAFKPDLVTPQQPTRLMYYGAQGTIQIDAYYQSGFELGNMDGPMAENAAVTLVAPDPYFYSPTQQGTTLAPRTALGSVHNIVNRNALGKWGTMLGGAQNVGGFGVAALATRNGTVYVGGDFGTAGGTNSPNLAFWNYGPALWGTFGGTPSSTVEALALAPSGSLYFGGLFTSAAGTAGARFIAQLNGAGSFGTLIGGTVNNEVTSLLYSPFGTLFAGGAFTSVAGSSGHFAALWSNNLWGTLNGQQSGTLNGFVLSMTTGLDKKLLLAGSFGSAGGTAVNYVASWANAFGSMGAGMNGTVTVITTAPNGQIIAGGSYTTAGGVSARNVAGWNNVQWAPFGSGLQYSVPSSIRVYAANVSPSGDVLMGGLFGTAGDITLPDSMSRYVGGAWVPLDIDLPGQAQIQALLTTPNGDLYAGGVFDGTAQAASVGTIVNSGKAKVYPNLRLRNLGAGTARLYQVLNTLTDARLYFNLILYPGEQALLVTQPGARSFQSSFQGNIFGNIVPSSNLAAFNLLPGTNYVSFFSDSDNLEAAFFWQPRGWSVDSGTVL